MLGLNINVMTKTNIPTFSLSHNIGFVSEFLADNGMHK